MIKDKSFMRLSRGLPGKTAFVKRPNGFSRLSCPLRSFEVNHYGSTLVPGNYKSIALSPLCLTARYRRKALRLYPVPGNYNYLDDTNDVMFHPEFKRFPK